MDDKALTFKMMTSPPLGRKDGDSLQPPWRTFDECPLVVGAPHVGPVDALVVRTQPVDKLLLPVVVQREDRTLGGQ